MKDSDSLTIVAIPDQNDPVWEISSEKVPHMTLLFLGDQSDNPNVGRMIEYTAHASSKLGRFGLSVDHRGLLGDHSADVLFFDDLLIDRIKNFRSNLLAQGDIFEAYCSTQQYPSWTPHLTLGYPKTPARPDKREYKGLHFVNFDRIAIWTGDYSGPEFRLDDNMMRGGVGMSDMEEALSHFGVKGMKWGVRKDTGSAGSTRADQKWGKKAAKFSTFSKVYNSASKRMNDVEISRINNKPQYKNADFSKDSPLRKKYYKEFNDTMERIVNEESLKIVGKNPSGTKKLTYHAAENGDISFKFEDVKHADDDVEFIGKVDSTGRIVSVFVKQESMAQEGTMEEALQHFGILGMKWGVRKDKSGRNSDGSEPVTVTQNKPGGRLKAKGGRGHGANEDAVGAVAAARKVKKSGLQSLSNKELQSLVQRMNLEQQYIGLKEKEPTAFRQGMKTIKNILSVGKTVNEVHQMVNSPAGKELQGLLKR